jgi:hypothetical protein
VRYLGTRPVAVQGPTSRRRYQFSAAQPVMAVEIGDADALLRTRLFRRAAS